MEDPESHQAGANTQELDTALGVENIEQSQFYEHFYHEFTRSIELQENLRRTKLLVGGWGSIGWPVVTTGVRSGM